MRNSQHWIQTSFQPTLKMLNSVYLHWKTAVGAIEEVPGVVWSLSLHPIPPSFYKNSGSTGNSLGLEDRSGVLVVAGLTVSWVDSAHDGLVEETARAMMDGIEHDAREAGLYDPFLYLNYASAEQKPIEAYGAKSLEHLRKVSKRVDPNGVFSRQVPGGFKIPVAPE